MKFIRPLFLPTNNQTKLVWRDILETANLTKEYVASKVQICEASEKELSPLETAIALKNLKHEALSGAEIQEPLEAEKVRKMLAERMQNLQNLIKNELKTTYAGFTDRTLAKIADLGLKGKEKFDFINSEIMKASEAISLNPEIKKSTAELFEFGPTQKTLAFGALGIRALNPEKRVLAAGSVQAALATTLLSQPIVAKVGTELVSSIEPLIKKPLEVIGRILMSGANGKLENEFFNMFNGGDPMEYLFSGVTQHERDKNKIKDPANLENLENIDKYLGHEFRDFYTAKNEYETNPEKIQNQIPSLAEFCASTIKSNISVQELELAIRKMNNNEWDDKVIKKAFVMTHMGTVAQFMQSTASPKDRDLFFDLLRQNLDDSDNEALTDAKIDTYLPGINTDRMSIREKSDVLSFMKNGFSGLALTAVIGSLLFGQLFSFVGNVFRGTELSSKGYNVISKPFKLAGKVLLLPVSLGKKIAGILGLKNRPKAFDKYINTFSKTKNKDGFPMFTKEEAEKLKKLDKKQKTKIINAVNKQWKKKKDKKRMTADDFWDLPETKDITAEIRDKVD